ncbi:UAA transporter [Microthyrium microscopicum]|uniref:UDP-galactose transporter homolog 1 n=1 Tax=Microthyrium microscopicum TaxID=703497 RepID=A0A6A6U014_9PEZI|nr:UAA transporter [Microthyrium microscopicum]
MAREKKPAVRREPSETVMANGSLHQAVDGILIDEASSKSEKASIQVIATPNAESQPGVGSLLICVGGIYASFLTWGILQERITTTTYGPAWKSEKFKYPIFLNTVYSIFAALSGLVYLYAATSHPHKPGRPAPIFPTAKILPPLLLVSITSSLASPFGYAALNYIDYITFLLAKSCKLLPVMFLHLTIFRKRYPLYKYLVVALVTLGVAIFTIHHPSAASKAAKHKSKAGTNASWGLFLLGINLLFDGLFNTTQDYIFTTFKPYSGPQMMCAQNILATALTSSYLLLVPFLAPTAIGQYLSLPIGDELREALAFIGRHPQVGYDVLAFSACGAFGQVFVFHTLATFSSLVLVTVNVTRKMLTMVLSVVYFGHKITPMQWLGVGLVFGGIGGEAGMGRREKLQKERKKGEAEKKEK